jgi:hypothetical protein
LKVKWVGLIKGQVGIGLYEDLHNSPIHALVEIFALFKGYSIHFLAAKDSFSKTVVNSKYGFT